MINWNQNFYQIVTSDSVAICRCNSTRKEFTIPQAVLSEEREVYKVISIYPSAFEKSAIQRLIIPADSLVTTICTKAFMNSNIKELFLSPSCKIFHPFSFLITNDSSIPVIRVINGNRDLSESNDHIILFKSVNVMHFQQDKKKVHLRESILKISQQACFGNHIISSVYFPASLRVIEESSFKYCDNLRKVAFAPCSQLEIIGKSAFSYSGILKISFPSSLKVIDSDAFSYCTELKYIIFPSNSKLHKIESRAFCKVSSRKLIFPASLVAIKSSAFYFCTNLSEIYFQPGSKLDFIGEKAFYRTGIKNVMFENNIKTIEKDAFADIKSIQYKSHVKQSNFSFNLKNKEQLLIKLSKGIKEAVSSINYFRSGLCVYKIIRTGQVGLYKCYHKGKIFNVPKEVTSPFNKVFAVVSVMSNAMIPSFCLNLTFPPDSFVYQLEEGFINRSFVKKVNIPPLIDDPEIIRTLHKLKVTAIVSKHSKNVKMENGIIYGIRQSDIKAIISSRKELFVREGIERITIFSCRKYVRINKIVFPSSLVAIEESAFEGASTLEKIRFTQNCRLKVIGVKAFASTGIKFLRFPANLEKIDEYAFDSCNQLRKVTFDSNIVKTIIDIEAFSNCAQLKSTIIFNNQSTENLDSISGLVKSNDHYENNQQKVNFLSFGDNNNNINLEQVNDVHNNTNNIKNNSNNLNAENINISTRTNDNIVLSNIICRSVYSPIQVENESSDIDVEKQYNKEVSLDAQNNHEMITKMVYSRKKLKDLGKEPDHKEEIKGGIFERNTSLPLFNTNPDSSDDSRKTFSDEPNRYVEETDSNDHDYSDYLNENYKFERNSILTSQEESIDRVKTRRNSEIIFDHKFDEIYGDDKSENIYQTIQKMRNNKIEEKLVHSDDYEFVTKMVCSKKRIRSQKENNDNLGNKEFQSINYHQEKLSAEGDFLDVIERDIDINMPNDITGEEINKDFNSGQQETESVLLFVSCENYESELKTNQVSTSKYNNENLFDSVDQTVDDDSLNNFGTLIAKNYDEEMEFSQNEEDVINKEHKDAVEHQNGPKDEEIEIIERGVKISLLNDHNSDENCLDETIEYSNCNESELKMNDQHVREERSNIKIENESDEELVEMIDVDNIVEREASISLSDESIINYDQENVRDEKSSYNTGDIASIRYVNELEAHEKENIEVEVEIISGESNKVILKHEKDKMEVLEDFIERGVDMSLTEEKIISEELDNPLDQADSYNSDNTRELENTCTSRNAISKEIIVEEKKSRYFRKNDSVLHDSGNINTNYSQSKTLSNEEKQIRKVHASVQCSNLEEDKKPYKLNQCYWLFVLIVILIFILIFKNYTFKW